MKSDSLCKKVSVSLPSNLHKWLIQEAQKESQNRGSRVTVSSLIQETLNELKKKNPEKFAQKNPSKPSKASPVVGAKMATLSGSLGSGLLKATTKTSRRAG